MGTEDLATRLMSLLEPEAEAHGFELVAVEQAGGRGVPIIRVLLDREGGIDIEALAKANDWIGATFDAENPINGPYTLEVSSPGVDRPLVRRSDFQRFAGETATVSAMNDGRRVTRTGKLLGIEGDTVLLEADGERHEIPYESIRKARLKGVVDFGKGKERD
ncbi:MAG: ribosome maturation factor RimP [Coriobacteriia bacterium]